MLHAASKQTERQTDGRLMRLPNGGRADSILGITASTAGVLRRALLDAAAASDGDVYTLRVPVSTAKGAAMVLSVWIVRRRRLSATGDVLYRVNMESEIHMHDVVALLEDTRARHLETDRPLLLRRGQIGTVVMTYNSTVFEVEFAGKDGRAYAILPIHGSKLMILRDAPDYAVA